MPGGGGLPNQFVTVWSSRPVRDCARLSIYTGISINSDMSSCWAKNSASFNQYPKHCNEIATIVSSIPHRTKWTSFQAHYYGYHIQFVWACDLFSSRYTLQSVQASVRINNKLKWTILAKINASELQLRSKENAWYRWAQWYQLCGNISDTGGMKWFFVVHHDNTDWHYLA